MDISVQPKNLFFQHYRSALLEQASLPEIIVKC